MCALCPLCFYLCDFFVCAIQTACRQSRACPVQTGSAVTVPSVETKPQGNTMEPPAVMAVKASSDVPYARAMSTPAGTDSKNIYCVSTQIHRIDMNEFVHKHTFVIMCRYLDRIVKLLKNDFSGTYQVKLCYTRAHFVIRFCSVKLLMPLYIQCVQVQQAVHCG